jgi:uncharacterized protein (TIGR04255 family)
MKIPKKITPDRIRDSIVELRYQSDLPFEVAIGMFYSALDDTYAYTNRPIETSTPNQVPLINNSLTLRIGSHNLFFNDKIKIQLQPSSIIFNCLNEYISWSNYREEINKVLKQLLTTDVINYFERIGVRYISDYEKTNLLDCVNFNFSFGMDHIHSDQYSFRSEFHSDKIRVVLNLAHSIPRLVKEDSEPIPTSTIDVDAIFSIPNTSRLEDFMPLIDLVHNKEKEMFFSILKPDFLETLQPEY